MRSAGASGKSVTTVLCIRSVVGSAWFEMGTVTSERDEKERFTLTVDDRGRVTLPERVRERLGIEPNDEIPASLAGSVFEIDPEPSAKLQTATAGRDGDEWEGSTTMDAGVALFGPMDDRE